MSTLTLPPPPTLQPGQLTVEQQLRLKAENLRRLREFAALPKEEQEKHRTAARAIGLGGTLHMAKYQPLKYRVKDSAPV